MSCSTRTGLLRGPARCAVLARRSVGSRSVGAAIAIAVLLATAALAGCGWIGTRESGPGSSAGEPPVVASPESPGVPPQTPAAAPDPLADSFAELLATLPAGAAGVVVAAADQTLSFGYWSVGPAWSTIKVPLSIAALRADTAAAEPLMTRAITASDNDAAMGLWQLLGAPAAAGERVQAVLAEGGSPQTQVQTEQIYPPYSPFGQTQWAQADMARFTFGLPCVPGAEPVLEQMRRISGGQRWGLADTDTPTKGGWGPNPGGGYLVRQLALVSVDTGTVGVALAAQPDDGSFATGVAMIDALADWIRAHRAELPAGHCAPPPG